MCAQVEVLIVRLIPLTLLEQLQYNARMYVEESERVPPAFDEWPCGRDEDDDDNFGPGYDKHRLHNACYVRDFIQHSSQIHASDSFALGARRSM